MLGWIESQADTILAAVNVGFTFTLVPTALHQWRVKASTVPLLTSTVTFGLLAVILVIWLATRWWLAFATDIANMSVWAVVAAQRIVYGAPKEEP